ncbi:Interferon-induced guanylate-binding protein 1 [Platysternon megacephalum]|uniref:Interferon-induced guanylate-binding protein 1 n=1 Tax=Platysternon megacephalum TaxID=55544 RepID=A0A4D9DLC5_9SAUR|nr:Interferon-induced guanylate-binding protein 1 [Platysternon megacephalum]
MAAAQGGKRRQPLRTQKAQQDEPWATPKQGKHQPQAGHQMRQKPATKQLKSCQGKKGLGKNGVPTRYASKMLQQMRKVRMSAKAKGLMKSFMADIYSQVSTEAEHLRKQKRLLTLGSSEVQAALQQVMPREVAKHSATPVCNESV